MKTCFVIFIAVIGFCPNASLAQQQQQPALPDSLQFGLAELSTYRREVKGKNGIKGYVLDANYHKMPAAERQIQRQYYDSAYLVSCRQLTEKRGSKPTQVTELMWIEKLKKDSVYFLKRKRNMAWFDEHYPPKK
jgi:hypothetical protein